MGAQAYNTLQFPERITFRHITELYADIQQIMHCYDTIIFDLTQTQEVHAAFVGFLIYLKTEKEKENGSVKLHLSPTVERLLLSLDLGEFFTQVKRSA